MLGSDLTMTAALGIIAVIPVVIPPAVTRSNLW
jgi:hypothetical protein